MRRDGCRDATVRAAEAMLRGRRQADAIRLETRASDASGDVRQDAWAGEFPVLRALQVARCAEKLVVPELGVPVLVAVVLPAEVSVPCTRDAGRFAA